MWTEATDYTADSLSQTRKEIKNCSKVVLTSEGSQPRTCHSDRDTHPGDYTSKPFQNAEGQSSTLHLSLVWLSA